ncbi:hypothetical protein QX201_009449 [Fusarium graminearum]
MAPNLSWEVGLPLGQSTYIGLHSFAFMVPYPTSKSPSLSLTTPLETLLQWRRSLSFASLQKQCFVSDLIPPPAAGGLSCHRIDAAKKKLDPPPSLSTVPVRDPAAAAASASFAALHYIALPVPVLPT